MQHCLSHVNRTQHRRAVEGQTNLPHGASVPKSRGCHSAMPMAGAILQCHQGWRLLKVARRMCQSLTPGRELPLLNAEPCELCCRSQLNNRPLLGTLGRLLRIRFSFIFCQDAFSAKAPTVTSIDKNLKKLRYNINIIKPLRVRRSLRKSV